MSILDHQSLMLPVFPASLGGERRIGDRAKRLKRLRSRFFIGLSALVLVVLHGAHADTVPVPTITRQAFITAERDVPIKPLAVAQTNDGGLIIAGRAGSAAWAAKTDVNGKVLWNYYARSKNKAQAGLGADRFSPEFLDAVSMPDGSIYLCGYKPSAPNAYAPGLIAHLDSQGQVLAEQLVIPQNRPERGIARLDRCARWGDGIVFQGHLVDWSRGFNGAFSRNDLYWLLVLDAGGNVRWEKLFPMSSDLAGSDEFSPLLVMTDSSLVFSSHKNASTELIQVSSKGELLASKQLPGRFQIVEPVAPDGKLQVLGWLAADTAKIMTVLTLSNGLEEVGRVQRQSVDYFARVAYRLADQSLIVFGSRSHVYGENYTSEIVHLAAGLLTEKRLDPPRNRSPFLDSGSIWAAAPIGEAGEFVSVRGLSLAPDFDDSGSSGVPQGFRRGVELDFILTK